MLSKTSIFGSKRIKSLPDFVRVWRKNRHLNKGLRNFARGKSHEIIVAREKEFLPEVIIPCYNQGEYLTDTLSSIHSPNRLDITVVNDSSTDNTAEYIQTLSKRFSFKIITNTKNLNQSGSINRAIEESNNNLFIMLNADDALVKYSIHTVLEIFKKHTHLRLVGGGNIIFSDGNTLRINQDLPEKLLYIPKMQVFTPEEALNFTSLNDLNMTMSGSTFLRSAWEMVGGFKNFDQRVCSYDDRDFQMRVATLFPVAVIEEPLAFYRTDSSVNKSQE